MIEDIAELIVRSTGGFWNWRVAMLKHKNSYSRNLYQKIYYLHQKKYCAFIGHSAQISSEPCFPHSLNGIFIAGGAKIGSNCVIFHQVTIGAHSIPFSNRVGAPTIGDNCFIGAGAMVIGSVTVGNNCRIGANCVVASDVPENSIVVAEKSRIITKTEPLLNKYYRWSPHGPIYFDKGQWILETDPLIIENLNHNL